jgi:hypothetical protein
VQIDTQGPFRLHLHRGLLAGREAAGVGIVELAGQAMGRPLLVILDVLDLLPIHLYHNYCPYILLRAVRLVITML